MPRSRTSLLVLGLALAAIVAVVVVIVTRPSDQEQLTVERTGGPVSLAALNRSDELGADTVRAYLRAAMDCSTQGADVRRRLSGPGNGSVQALVDATYSAGPGTWPKKVRAEATVNALAGEQRARRRIEAGQALPSGLVVYVMQVRGAWTIDGRCLRQCDSEGTSSA